ncbi:MAG TPA: DUF883 family protein [Azospira sp.]|nr:DUF883 family protein [Azospira sp.]
MTELATGQLTGQGTVEGRKETLAKDFKGIAHDADQLMKDVSTATADGYAAAKTSVEAGLGAAKARLGDARSAVAETARSAAGAADVYVRENPWAVLGAAAAVGVALGLLLHRR